MRGNRLRWLEIFFLGGYLIHIAWFTLDLVIVITYLLLCKKLYLKKVFFVLIYLVVLLVLVFSFNMWSSGMLISCFVIDFVMAVEYFIYSSKEAFPANRLSISICSLKLCGDLCAWIYYMEKSRFVLVVGFLVLILNILCLKTMIKRNYKWFVKQKSACRWIRKSPNLISRRLYDKM